MQIDNQYELAIVDLKELQLAKAISSVLTRSLEDAKYTKGGYLPPQVVERVQRDLISPYGVIHQWGKTGYRFVLSREASQGKREIICTALIHANPDGIFFFTGRFNNLQHQDLDTALDFDHSADGHPHHKWFDKFAYPPLSQYKPQGFHHFANFVVEKNGARGLGLSRLMIQEIVKNYSKLNLVSTGRTALHAQPLLEGQGLWQIGDPPWLARMKNLGFYLRLGSETFHIEKEWDPLFPIFDKEGKKIDHISYNQSFSMPDLYLKMLENSDIKDKKIEQNLETKLITLPLSTDLRGNHLLTRIPEVIKMCQSGKHKLQYFQLILNFISKVS